MNTILSEYFHIGYFRKKQEKLNVLFVSFFGIS